MSAISQNPPDCFFSGGYIFFVGVADWLFDKRQEIEDKMRSMQKEGIWRWILMKETQEKFDADGCALIYAFKVLKQQKKGA